MRLGLERGHVASFELIDDLQIAGFELDEP